MNKFHVSTSQGIYLTFASNAKEAKAQVATKHGVVVVRAWKAR